MSGFSTVNPATGDEITRYAYMSDAEAEDVVLRCHSAFLDWRMRSLEDRASVLRNIAGALREREDAFAALMTDEMGKLLSQSHDEIGLCAAICEYTADQGPGVLAPEERDLMRGRTGRVVYEPIGVVYGIQPWNFPCYQAVRYSIANLMAGNGVLLKHAANVTGSGRFLADLYESAGLPKDLFSVLVIDHDQSDRIIANDFVRGVTLTGSPEAGRHVGAEAGKHLKKTVLELGSNDAYLVLADADLDRAVKTCVKGRTYNNGETCVAAKRFIVVDDVYDAFRDRFVDAMKALKPGDPTSDDADIGPMAREDLRDRLHEQVQESVEKGATVLCGGAVPDGPGYYYPATVLENVTPGQPAYDDELFGPVATLLRATDTGDAMRIANDSRFGLGGGIFSRDVEKARTLAEKHFDTGMVFINGFGLAQPMMPFGGVKNSGFGREHGGEGMREFVNVKSVFTMAA